MQVICDAYSPNGTALPSNKRAAAAKIFNEKAVIDEETWYCRNSETAIFVFLLNRFVCAFVVF